MISHPGSCFSLNRGGRGPEWDRGINPFPGWTESRGSPGRVAAAQPGGSPGRGTNVRTGVRVPGMCPCGEKALQARCKSIANQLQTHCKLIVNSLQAHCKPIACQLQACCKPLVSLLQGYCKLIANPLQIPFKSIVNLLQTSCKTWKPMANSWGTLKAHFKLFANPL